MKGVCFFLLMICLIAFKNETKRNPNYGKMNGLDPEMWWSRVSFIVVMDREGERGRGKWMDGLLTIALLFRL